MPYARGRYAIAICPVSGFQVRHSTLRRRWDGLWTSQEDFDEKHPQLDPLRRIYDPQAIPHPWPDSQETESLPATLPQLETVVTMTFSPDNQPTE